MYPTFEIQPKTYERKLKSSDGVFTGEVEIVPQVDLPSFNTYSFDFSNARNPEDARHKLILASKNNDKCKVQGSTDVNVYNNGSKGYVFNVIDVEYAPKSAPKN